jgi:xanthine/uracil permease
MKGLLIAGIVLILIGLGAGFGPQIYETLSTGFPSTGIPLLQTSGFVVAALGAVLIGAFIGKRRARRKQASQDPR